MGTSDWKSMFTTFSIGYPLRRIACTNNSGAWILMQQQKEKTVSSVKSVPKNIKQQKSQPHDPSEEIIMEFNIFYKKKNDWFIGHIQEYPDYESQGRTLDELKKNLIEIHNDINEGLVPDAEPFQLMEIAIWKGKNCLDLLSQTGVCLCVMVAITIGIGILNPA